MKKFLNVLSVFASIILTIVFVITAFALPVYYSVAGILKPKTITTVIQNIDYVEVLKESTEISEAFEEIGLKAEITDEIIKSDEFGGLLEDVAGELTTILGSSEADLSALDAATLQGLINEHIDGILTVVEEKTDIPIEKEEIKAEIDKVIETNAEAIEQTVLELEPVKEAIVTYETVTQTVQRTLKWQYALVLGLVEALFLGLIYLLRHRNYGGFIWIAVNTGIVGLLVSGVAGIVGSGFLKQLASELPNFAVGMVDAAVASALTKLTIALIVCFAVMVLSIVACVMLRIRKRKLAEKALNNPEENVEAII